MSSLTETVWLIFVCALRLRLLLVRESLQNLSNSDKTMGKVSRRSVSPIERKTVEVLPGTYKPIVNKATQKASFAVGTALPSERPVSATSKKVVLCFYSATLCPHRSPLPKYPQTTPTAPFQSSTYTHPSCILFKSAEKQAADDIDAKWKSLQSKAKPRHAVEGCDRTWEVALPVALLLLDDRGQRLRARWSAAELLRIYEKKRASRDKRRERRRAAKAKVDAERAKEMETPMSKKMKNKLKDEEMMVRIPVWIQGFVLRVHTTRYSRTCTTWHATHTHAHVHMRPHKQPQTTMTRPPRNINEQSAAKRTCHTCITASSKPNHETQAHVPPAICTNHALF
jgi:hypothetical protein